jgi:hypothetical protein
MSPLLITIASLIPSHQVTTLFLFLIIPKHLLQSLQPPFSPIRDENSWEEEKRFDRL